MTVTYTPSALIALVKQMVYVTQDVDKQDDEVVRFIRNFHSSLELKSEMIIHAGISSITLNDHEQDMIEQAYKKIYMTLEYC